MTVKPVLVLALLAVVTAACSHQDHQAIPEPPASLNAPSTVVSVPAISDATAKCPVVSGGSKIAFVDESNGSDFAQWTAGSVTDESPAWDIDPGARVLRPITRDPRYHAVGHYRRARARFSTSVHERYVATALRA